MHAESRPLSLILTCLRLCPPGPGSQRLGLFDLPGGVGGQRLQMVQYKGVGISLQCAPHPTRPCREHRDVSVSSSPAHKASSRFQVRQFWLRRRLFLCAAPAVLPCRSQCVPILHPSILGGHARSRLPPRCPGTLQTMRCTRKTTKGLQPHR